MLAVCLALVWAGSARGQENHFNPGLMGANALPPQPGEAPWVVDEWGVLLSVAAQQARPVGGGRDLSLTFPFRVDYGFARRVSLIVEGTPVEAWVVSQQTAEAWRPTRGQGLTKGDIRIGAKFLLYEGSPTFPGVAFRALTKTTTGKGGPDRRFMDAPGYLFDIIGGKQFAISESLRLEAWLAAGFLAWQQAGFGQNDALSLSATVLAHLRFGTVRLEARGYRGWQKYDKPLVLSAGVELPLFGGNRFITTVNYSVRDPLLVGVQLGVRFGTAGGPPEAGTGS
ncbi:MAG: hypothetical protein L0Y64_05115 [Myxococcaceae bacterium]|nr:hypothetical protein [Myxococcaceae bacterium]